MKLVFGAKNCHKCKLLTKELQDKNETFKYVDINELSMKEISDLGKMFGTELPIEVEMDEEDINIA